MSMTASEMGKLSVEARRKKHGGKQGLADFLRTIAKKPRKRRLKVVHTSQVAK